MSFLFLHIEKHQLQFIKPAKTSRGEYIQKDVWIVGVSNERIRENIFGEGLDYQPWFENYRQKKKEDPKFPLCIGFGEAAPLPDLSVDGKFDLSEVMGPYLDRPITLEEIKDLLSAWQPRSSKPFQSGLTETDYYPTLRFALHCALEQYFNGGRETWYTNSFSEKLGGIKINGLVWMNEIEAMYQEAKTKILSGFHCIKFKVGALDFDAECRLIESIRKEFDESKVEIRLDANGAFAEADALEKLKELQRFYIHSIEQPIRAGSEFLEEMIAKSLIRVALDEELIGLSLESGRTLLKRTKPQYLILKPTLLGGLDLSDEWIQLATKENIGWWSTSALEGNVGLYSIAHWVSNKHISMPQGLGTGSLYQTNFASQTYITGESLWKK